ncbi:MAG: type I pullulanase [Clostridiales bacterium]|nr:type I pullulanase [Clostridiales bacterium]
MKKKISMLLLLILLVTSVPIHSFAADQTEMIIHYHRFDGNYEGWNMWIWPNGQNGTAYEFSEEDEFGKVARVMLEDIADIEEIGFIVRKGEWEAKDVDSDRFVPTSQIDEEGNLEFYLIQGSESIYFDENEIDLSPKFLAASFIDEKTLKLTSSKPIEVAQMRTDFSIADQEGNAIEPAAISAGGGAMAQNFVVLLKESVIIGNKYQTVFQDYLPVGIDLAGLYDSEAFESQFGYDGKLGAIYSDESTDFKVWSPVADEVTLNLYESGDGDTLIESITMTKGDKGVWSSVKEGDLHGVYYTFSVSIDGIIKETYDPYAVGAGVNGDRSMVVDFERTNPSGWSDDKGPVYKKMNDAIVYEMHIRDLSIHPSSGIENSGKFLGVVEKDTQTKEGVSTGLSHLKELGVTHVQILPMYDFNSIDESRLEDNVFNWGYDPKNYNVPEGSYSSDPYSGEVRIQEMKQMIKGLHDENIGVIMDVVYNHTALSGDSNLTLIMPDYYYRMDNGAYSNASGTGNETASERIMVRKLITDSLIHWVKEYHVDGFRFDLMGVHDIETMKWIESELRAINPDIILYGEGWTGGTSTLPDSERLIKANMQAVDRIGAFADEMRDGIKGHVFNAEEAGFAGGAEGLEESVKFGIVGAVLHPQINYDLVNYSNKPWASHPSQSVNYVSAHDNLTLWDKFLVTNPEATDAERIQMHKLSNAIVMTSQGMPFLHAGVDFLRTKSGDHNSYKSPDAINQIDWNRKAEYQEVFEYYKGLISLRKAYPAMRLETQQEVEQWITFFDDSGESLIEIEDQMIGYMIHKDADPDKDETLLILFNGGDSDVGVNLPGADYNTLLNRDQVTIDGGVKLKGGITIVPAQSALVLSTADVLIKGETLELSQNDGPDNSIFIYAGIVAVIVIGGIIIARKKHVA